MVVFTRLSPDNDHGYQWWARNGVVYSVSDGLNVLAYLYWAWMGFDGAWIHLDTIGRVDPMWAAAAMRLGMRRVIPPGIAMAQTFKGSRMSRILGAIGFRKIAEYEDDEKISFEIYLQIKNGGVNYVHSNVR